MELSHDTTQARTASPTSSKQRTTGSTKNLAPCSFGRIELMPAASKPSRTRGVVMLSAENNRHVTSTRVRCVLVEHSSYCQGQETQQEHALPCQKVGPSAQVRPVCGFRRQARARRCALPSDTPTDRSSSSPAPHPRPILLKVRTHDVMYYDVELTMH